MNGLDSEELAETLVKHGRVQFQSQGVDYSNTKRGFERWHEIVGDKVFFDR